LTIICLLTTSCYFLYFNNRQRVATCIE